MVPSTLLTLVLTHPGQPSSFWKDSARAGGSLGWPQHPQTPSHRVERTEAEQGFAEIVPGPGVCRC